jgi:hypothetical protein
MSEEAWDTGLKLRLSRLLAGWARTLALDGVTVAGETGMFPRERGHRFIDKFLSNRRTYFAET